MKTVNSKNTHYTLTLLIVACIAFALTRLPSEWALSLFYIFWLFPILLLFFILSPLGKITIQSKNPIQKTPIHKRIIFILIPQLALVLAYAGFCNIINWTTSIPHIQGNTALFSHTLPLLMQHFGLMPWSLLTILTLGLAFYSHVKHDNTDYNQLGAPFIKILAPWQNLTNLTKVTFQISNRFAIGGLIMTLTVLITQWLLIGSIEIIHGPNLATVIFALILIIIISIKAHELLTRASFVVLPTLILFSMPVILALILTLCSLFLQPLTKIILPVTQLFPAVSPQHWHTLWLLLSLAWWLFWAPLIAPIFARHCQGYTIRNNILTLMALPLVALLLVALNNEHIINLHWFGVYIQNSPLCIALSTLSMASLLILIFSKKNSTSTIMASLPLSTNKKFRSPSMALKSILIISSFSLGIYLFAGLPLLTWYWLIPMLTPVIMVICISITLVKTLWQHQFNKS